MNGSYHPCSHPSSDVLETIPIAEARLHHIIVRRCLECLEVFQRVEKIV